MMKNILLPCTVMLSLFLSQNGFSQNLTGKEAHLKIPGATRIVMEQDGVTPRMVNFDPAQAMDLAQLEELEKLLFGNGVHDDWKLIRSETDELGFVHTRYQQTYKQLNVDGNVYIFHSKNGRVVSANGVFYPGIAVSTNPSLTLEVALSKSIEGLANPVSLVNMERATAELVILKVDKDYRLAYKCDLLSHNPLINKLVYVDANSGKILREMSRICDIDADGIGHAQFSGSQTIVTDSLSSTNYLLRESGRGSGIETINSNTNNVYQDADNDWNNVNVSQDEFAVDVHFGAERTYDFYFDHFGRDSYDDAGGFIRNYANDETVGVNAYWSGGGDNTMHYGNGDSDYFPVASLEVAGHELSHGVTEYSAGLEYMDESGALNESFSDIFGNTIRFLYAPTHATWYIGDQLLRPGGFGEIAFRNMSNPNEFENADTYGGDFFNAGDIVHYDSGIQNFWYYLLVNGGSGTNDLGNSYNVSSIGMDDAMRIAYRNLVYYLTPSSTFMDARNGAEQAAIDLFGSCSPQQFEVIHAWYAVGVGGPNAIGEVTAQFTNDPDFTCAAPLTTQFTSIGNYDAYLWDFGDGTTSTLQNPSHTYMTNGNFDVTLNVSSTSICTGSDNLTIADAVIVNPVLPIAGCTVAPVGTTAIPISFTDASQYNPSIWEWNFGDGATSSQQNPTHSYAAEGTYTVTLIVTNCAGSDTTVVEIEVVDQLDMCQETFTNRPSGMIYDSGSDQGEYDDLEDCSLLIQPCNASSITLTFEMLQIEEGYDYLWVYDGVDVSGIELANVTGTASPGAVTATSGSVYIVFRSDESVTMEGFQLSYTSVLGGGLGSADFIPSDVTPGVAQMVDFSGPTNINIVSWSWTFGDGGVSSLNDPSHSYVAAGTYPVTVTVTYCDGSTGTSTQNVVVHTVGIDELSSDAFQLSVSPNPFKETLHITTKEPVWGLSVQIMDMSGRIVYDFTSPEIIADGLIISPNNLSGGQYVMKAVYNTESRESVLEHHKLIVSH